MLLDYSIPKKREGGGGGGGGERERIATKQNEGHVSPAACRTSGSGGEKGIYCYPLGAHTRTCPIDAIENDAERGAYRWADVRRRKQFESWVLRDRTADIATVHTHERAGIRNSRDLTGLCADSPVH